MSKTRQQQTGQEGEDLACDFLRTLGHEILHRNFRFKRAEVDIISRDGDTLVFTEVKTRSRTDFGLPETDVDEKKQKLLSDAAEEFIYQHNHSGAVRFDVVAIVMHKKQAPQIHHIKDAFWIIG